MATPHQPPQGCTSAAHHRLGDVRRNRHGGFADRARRDLNSTGEKARKRIDETRTELTTQETLIARLAAEGITNAQIGAQLYLGPRTIEWHLRHIYPKFGLTSRHGLAAAYHSR
jgi:DNA-binding NarL/FixJ family response regulator